MATRTLEQLNQDFQNLQRRIATEGITNDQGQILQAPTISDSPKQPTYADMFNEIKKWWEEQMKNGMAINPNIEITPEHAAEFLTRAKSEVAPYYSSQLGAARSSLLSSLGFSKEETLAKEQALERKYGLDVRKLGEQAAETGFTFSGRRQEQERQLAEETQTQIESQRRSLGYGSEQLASAYGLKYGGANIPQETISQAPRALPGETSFTRSGSQPLYQLSPDIYDQLIGSEQKTQAKEGRELSQFYESQYRTEQERRKLQDITLGNTREIKI